MQAVHRWRNLWNLKNSITYSTTQVANFHSTSICNEKWKKKWNSDFKKGEQPTKDYVRYVTRQKRADAKKALRNLLYKGGLPGSPFQDDNQRSKKHGATVLDEEPGNDHNGSSKTGRSKPYSRRARKAYNSKMKRKFTRDYFSGDEQPENIFQATFGNRWYTWTFNSWHKNGFNFENSSTGFEWREDTYHHAYNRYKKEETSEAEDEGCDVGSQSDRTILGLPPRGPLKMVDVKKAFHLSALRWHPDKHQGPSQAAAEEKFKRCVNAYKSLCSSLPAA